MSADRFTILLPITRPPVLVPYAVESVLAQTHAEFELFVVCDGAPSATLDWARAAAVRDARIRVFDFSKGQRHGEAHRHTALGEATGTFIAHIADDDLWFPEFLAEMALHLRTFDFGNLIQCNVELDGRITSVPGDLATAGTQQRMLRPPDWNFFGPTVAGYRLSAYQQLVEGWTPAPPNLWTDLHMWRKFLGQSQLTFGTRFAIQSATFAMFARREWSLEQRVAEIAPYAQRIRDSDTRRDFAAAGFRALSIAAKSELIAEATARIASL